MQLTECPARNFLPELYLYRGCGELTAGEASGFADQQPASHPTQRLDTSVTRTLYSVSDKGVPCHERADSNLTFACPHPTVS